MNRLTSRGFSLVEMAVVLVVFGLVLAFGIPSFQSFNTHHQLKGATENIAAQMRMMREVSISSGTNQTMHFFYQTLGGDYHIHNGAIQGGTWSLPNNITYYWGAGTNSVMSSGPDGRMTSFGLIILQDPKGDKDTVSVMASGLVLVQ